MTAPPTLLADLDEWVARHPLDTRLSVHDTLSYLVTIRGYSLPMARRSLAAWWATAPGDIQLGATAEPAILWGNAAGARGRARILRWAAIWVAGRGWITGYTVLARAQ